MGEEDVHQLPEHQSGNKPSDIGTESCSERGDQRNQQHCQQQRKYCQRNRTGLEADALAEQDNRLSQRYGEGGKVISALLHGDDQKHQRNVATEGNGIDNHGRCGDGKPFQPILQVSHHSELAASTSRMISAVCPGVRPTRIPTASSAFFLSCAVPLPPETMAPAWPICLPSGAVKPAM